MSDTRSTSSNPLASNPGDVPEDEDHHPSTHPTPSEETPHVSTVTHEDGGNSEGIISVDAAGPPQHSKAATEPQSTTTPATATSTTSRIGNSPFNQPSSYPSSQVPSPLTPASPMFEEDGGHRGLFVQQFGAAMLKNIHQKRRAPCQCFCEVFLPVIFLVGLVAIWLATTEKNLSGVQPVNYDPTYPSIPSQLLASACGSHNGTQPVYGVPLCNDTTFVATVQAALNVSSGVPLNFSDPFALPGHRYLPPEIKDLRFALPLIQTMQYWALSLRMRVHNVPTLDEFIVMQWAAAASGIKPDRTIW